MPKTLRSLLFLCFVLALATASHAGGGKCPPRIGVIAELRNTNDLGFVDSTDYRSYRLDSSVAARPHVGHRVKVVAHIVEGTLDTLFVHTLDCLGHPGE